MTALSDLIARLEAAKRGTQKLGDKVLLACGWKTAPNFDRNNPRPYWIRPDGQSVATNRPNPTMSLDSALALKQTTGYTIIEFENGTGFQVEIDDETADAKTAPLGVCICILKAREAAR